jgi:hypothetical protein
MNHDEREDEFVRNEGDVEATFSAASVDESEAENVCQVTGANI